MSAKVVGGRVDGRRSNEIRTVRLSPGFLAHAEGSVLVEMGGTKVICSASVEDRVPPFLKGSGRGWVTAEYGMLPRSTHTRSEREASKGKIGGRTHEIQRLIGRSLRTVTNLSAFGERSITVDCDVIEADGGTRTASITGAWVALALAFEKLRMAGGLSSEPLTGSVAAISAGIVDGVELVDLCYVEDSAAEVDMNFVMSDRGEFVEVQGTAERVPFSRSQLDRLSDLAWTAIQELLAIQKSAL